MGTIAQDNTEDGLISITRPLNLPKDEIMMMLAVMESKGEVVLGPKGELPSDQFEVKQRVMFRVKRDLVRDPQKKGQFDELMGFALVNIRGGLGE